MTEIESVVEPNGVADDIGRESVAFVSIHPQIIDQWQLTCQYPLEAATHPVTLGVISGLVLGKPLGVLAFVGLAVGLRLVELPKEINWLQLLGVAFACGIGFTMSLFIAGLAFEHGGGDYFSGDRLGILVGSILSAVVAYALLHISLPHSTT